MDFELYQKDLDNATGDLLVVGVYEDGQLGGLESAVDANLDGQVSALLESGALSATYNTLNDPLYTERDGEPQKVLVVGLGKKGELDRDRVRKVTRSVAGYVAKKSLESVSVGTFTGADGFTEEMTLSLLLETYKPDEGKTDRSQPPKDVRILYAGKKPEEELSKGRAVGEAVNYARRLNNGASAEITPEYLAGEALKLRSKGLDVEVMGEAELEKDNFGSLLEVGRGSARESHVGIIRYDSGDPDAETIVLLGKGITFDTGGTNQKGSSGLETMRMDMSGAGNVLAVMSAVAELKPGVNVIGMFGAVENKDSASSYHPGDILYTRAGKTVEVMNTDAEGRNVLIDLIDKAREFDPDAVIDMATLTGSCAAALGKGPDAYAGVFTNSLGGKIRDALFEASERTGERVWELPVSDFHRDQLKSDRADLKHTGNSNKGAGASSAAAFLFEFSDGLPHVHIDIAGTAIQKNATGWGVQLILDYLMHQ